MKLNEMNRISDVDHANECQVQSTTSKKAHTHTHTAGYMKVTRDMQTIYNVNFLSRNLRHQ